MKSGEPVELLTSFSDALRAPAAPGVKVTSTVHEEPGARVAPQLLVRAKSPAFVPVIVTEEIVTSPAAWSLVNVIFCEPLVVATAWSPNDSDVGLWPRWTVPLPR